MPPNFREVNEHLSDSFVAIFQSPVLTSIVLFTSSSSCFSPSSTPKAHKVAAVNCDRRNSLYSNFPLATITFDKSAWCFTADVRHVIAIMAFEYSDKQYWPFVL